MGIKIFGKRTIELVSVIMGIICSIIFLYDRFVKPDKPDLVFDILSNAQIFNLNEEIDNLSISFGKENVTDLKNSIYLITINIRNQGEGDIKKEDIFNNSFGFKLENSKILDQPRIIDFTNPIFKEYLKISVEDSSEVRFDAIPINSNEGFTVKLFALGQKDISPKIIPNGYISGIGKMGLEKSYPDKNDKGFLDSKGFQIFALIVGTLYIIYLFLGFYFIIKRTIASRKRGKKVERFLRQRDSLPPDSMKWLYMFYATNIDFDILRIRKIWDNKDLTVDIVHFILEFRINLELVISSAEEVLREDSKYVQLGKNFKFFELLIKKQIIYRENDVVVFDDTFFSEFEKFTDFLMKINNSA